MFSEVSTEEQHICVCKYGLLFIKKKYGLLTCNRKLGKTPKSVLLLQILTEN